MQCIFNYKIYYLLKIIHSSYCNCGIEQLDKRCILFILGTRQLLSFYTLIFTHRSNITKFTHFGGDTFCHF